MKSILIGIFALIIGIFIAGYVIYGICGGTELTALNGLFYGITAAAFICGGANSIRLKIQKK